MSENKTTNNNQSDNLFGKRGILSDEDGGLVKMTRSIFLLLTIGMWMLVIWWAITQTMSRARYGTIFLGLMILIYLTNEIVTLLKTGNKRTASFLTIFGAVTIVSTTYLVIEYLDLIRVRVGYAYPHEYALALAMTIIIGYITYRKYGLAFLLVFIGTIVYGLSGQHIPGIFGHSGFSYERLLQILVTDIRGYYGSLTQIIAAWVALFLLFAGLLRGYDAFDLIIRIAFYAATFVKSGVAQSAVIASMIIGSVNGSAAANAAMTGAFTIPMMKKSGMRKDSAAGIEAVASSGGQLLPPVMGAAAFVMASLLGMTYWDVMIRGIIPAIIFLVSVAVAVHYTAVGQIQTETLDLSEHVGDKKSRAQLVWEGLRFFTPLALLVFILGYLRWTVVTAALYAVFAMIGTGILFPVIEATVSKSSSVSKAVILQFKNTIAGFVYGAEILAPIAIIVAAINAVVDIFQATGVPASLSLALLDLSGGVMLVAILLAMLICIILGLGMPTVAAYTIVAILVAPTLTQMFLLPELSVHYFVFYAAILSGLTPPIAIAVVVASGVAGSDFWRTSAEALKIAAPLYVIPIAFIYNPELVVGDMSFQTLLSVLVTIAGAVVIVHGLNYAGRLFISKVIFDRGMRLVFVGLGIVAMVHPNVTTQLGALAIVGLLLVLQFAIRRQLPIRIRQVHGRIEG
jgi:TRAP transporter 4TM/12TM fusion protein